jgi:hypothetical protein
MYLGVLDILRLRDDSMSRRGGRSGTKCATSHVGVISRLAGDVIGRVRGVR